MTAAESEEEELGRAENGRCSVREGELVWVLRLRRRGSEEAAAGAGRLVERRGAELVAGRLG